MQAHAPAGDLLLQLAPFVVIAVALILAVRALRSRPVAQPYAAALQGGGATRIGGAARFRNPANGYEENVGHAWLWCLLFGCFYFAVKGVWTHAVASFVLALLTFGLSWLVYPFFARGAVERNYLRRGWIPV